MQSSPVRRIVTTGAMGALSVVMALVPLLGYIPWFTGTSLTIMHVPVIIAAVLEGPVAGTIVGLIFGVTSLIKAATAPLGPFDVLFTNPLVSVLPRLFIGIAAWAVYRIFKGKFTPLSSALAGAVGGFTNTVLVLLMLAVTAMPELVSLMKTDSGAIPKVLFGIATSNGLLEAAAAAILTSAVVSAWLGISKIGGKAKLAGEGK